VAAQAAALMTQWADQVSPDNALREYPRPQMERPEWVNLNGLWDYAIVPNDETAFPKKYQGRILVPYPSNPPSRRDEERGREESRLVHAHFPASRQLEGRRILLNFARLTGMPRFTSTARKSAATPAATTHSPSISPPPDQ